MADAGHKTLKAEQLYWRQACVLIAAYKHRPHAVSLGQIQETISDFGAEDIARAERVAARLSDEASRG